MVWKLAIISSIASIFPGASNLQAYPRTIIASSIELPTSLLAIIYLTRPYVRKFYRKDSDAQ